MTLLAEIQSKCSAELIASRDHDAIAAAVNVGRTKIQSRMIGIGTVLATLGAAGGPFLDGLVTMGTTDRNVFWAMELIKAGNLDVGMQATRDQVTALAVAAPSVASSIGALLALAVVPDPITEFDVRVALGA
jgi:hypothetical protein